MKFEDIIHQHPKVLARKKVFKEVMGKFYDGIIQYFETVEINGKIYNIDLKK